jgi:RNA polymerase sigma-70 factor (ECF subfamily)
MMALAMSETARPNVSASVIAITATATFPRDRLVACKNGDRAAFRAFVQHHQRAVFACLSRMLGAGAHVDDLAQETFLRAFRAFDRFEVDGAAKASTWLLTIATRAAIDWKKKHRSPTVSLDEPESHQVAAATTPELEHARRQLGGALEEAALTLSDDQRIALVLSDFHGLSLAEIALATDVPEATAKTRVFRARERMRAALKTEWSEP